ncbi:hypothetical protein HO173_009581 [Letharia columbiana]|uniref:Early meiotic induction protein 1 n=1 Tax=Letharia columbiana TaxID=112416 RepID=A0A8H6FPA3_9LECA|nr:uncharacterized protein HO173_009581 [Letharia columbiana]KAF6232198.1 hypothetical protein HO173_009581 [Letharia columbiana]
MGWLWNTTKDPPPPNPITTTADPPTLPDQPPASPPDPTTTTHPRLPDHPPASTPDPTSLPPPITPATTLPTTLSCRSAFDAAFHCQSFGGQFAHVYRYGSLRGCGDHWADFWFCVRTNRGVAGEERRRERVRAWAAGREREKYGGGRRGVVRMCGRRGGGRLGGVWGGLGGFGEGGGGGRGGRGSEVGVGEDGEDGCRGGGRSRDSE